jgi:anaerobic selenocysteine-containing dehydrogenase
MAALRRTICNRDCPDACGIVATVEGGRVTKIAGDREHPVTQGFLCHRTSHYLRTQYDPARITTPLLRKDGRLEPVGWDEALDFAAKRLTAIREESGPAAIFHYRSGGSLGLLVQEASEVFFEHLGPVTLKRGDICSGAGEAAQEADFGVSDASDLDDLPSARHVLCWGKNVATSSPHTIPVLKAARARGTGAVLIDPVHHQTAHLCEAFVQPRPAADLELAMAVARVLFERGWIHREAESWCEGLDRFRELAHGHSVAAWCAMAEVSTAEATDLARRLHEGPTTILVGWGMARRSRGGAIVRALDALGAITGNVGVPGAGVFYYWRRRRGFRKLGRGTAGAARTIPEPLFGAEVLRAAAPPIRAVWVTAGNPVAMLPDANVVAESLRSRELVVVADSWLSDTAELAHLVLPTPSLLEADDLLGAYGHHYVGVARPVVPPPAGVKSDLEIYQALAERLGFGPAMAGTARQWKARMLDGDLGRAGVTVERLEERAVKSPIAPAVIFDGRRFPTPSGKARLLDELPPPLPPRDPAFPLLLTSISTPKSQSSQWAKTAPRPAEVTVHPDSAAGILDGELAELESAVGSMTVHVRHDARQRRDVAIVPKGGHLRDGSCANALTRAALTDLGEGGALYDEPVRLVPSSGAEPTPDP